VPAGFGQDFKDILNVMIFIAVPWGTYNLIGVPEIHKMKRATLPEDPALLILTSEKIIC